MIRPISIVKLVVAGVAGALFGPESRSSARYTSSMSSGVPVDALPPKQGKVVEYDDDDSEGMSMIQRELDSY